MMDISASEKVLLPEKLKRRNCPLKNMTEKKKFLKTEQLTDRVGWSFLNSEVKMLLAGQVQKASRAVCEMPQ